MICWTSFSNKTLVAAEVLVALVLSSCAAPQTQQQGPVEFRSGVRNRDTLIALLPVENLSGGQAPLDVVGRLLRMNLSQEAFQLLDEEVLEKFLWKHRIRNTGGLSRHASRAMREETGVGAFLITSLETYQDTEPPKISLFSRLVLSGQEPEILWMDSVGLSGEEFAGLLGLGRIREPHILLEKAVHQLTESLGKHLPKARQGLQAISETSAKYHPRTFFRSPTLTIARRYRVAVSPFFNVSERKNAGKIVMMHFVNELAREPRFSVVDPGLVREELLKYRIIMDAGLSLAAADLIFSRGSLGVDLLVSGTVFDYQDTLGIPKVDFSVSVFERESREVVWKSRSYNAGDEGVFFFDLGRVYTAHRLASDMTRAAVQMLSQ